MPRPPHQRSEHDYLWLAKDEARLSVQDYPHKYPPRWRLCVCPGGTDRQRYMISVLGVRRSPSQPVWDLLIQVRSASRYNFS